MVFPLSDPIYCEQVLVDPRLELSTRRVWLKDEAPLDTSDPRVTVAEDRVTIADLGKGDEGRLDQEIFSILYKQPLHSPGTSARCSRSTTRPPPPGC